MPILPGFHDLQDAFSSPASSLDPSDIESAIETATANHNAQLNGALEIFSFPTTDHALGVETAEAGELQGLDEYGRPRPTRGVESRQVQFPVFRAGNSIAFSYEASVEITVEAINKRLNVMLREDINSVMRWCLSALFTRDPYQYDDRTGHGALTVRGLARADDGFTYLRTSGLEGTDEHYLAQLEGIAATTNPITKIVAALQHHDVNVGGQIVVFISPDDETAVKGLPDFESKGDPDITPGSGERRLTGTFGGSVPGEIIGKTDGAWISKWHRIPAGYQLGVSTGGAQPLARRSRTNPALQGYRQDAQNVGDYPYLMRPFVRRLGFGAHNRVGAVISRTGNAAYAPPAIYVAGRA